MALHLDTETTVFPLSLLAPLPRVLTRSAIRIRIPCFLMDIQGTLWGHHFHKRGDLAAGTRNEKVASFNWVSLEHVNIYTEEWQAGSCALGPLIFLQPATIEQGHQLASVFHGKCFVPPTLLIQGIKQHPKKVTPSQELQHTIWDAAYNSAPTRA